MKYDTARELFKTADLDGDGKIDQGEFAHFVGADRNEGNYSTISRGGSRFGIGYGYRDGVDYRGSTESVFDQIDVNHDGVIDRGELNRYIGSSSSIVDTTYASRYPTDSRGFYLDPNPEIITRTDPSPAPLYTQNIIVRYLQPPPLPPVGENVIKEVRPPPLEAPAPFLIREPGKPGFQPPPLVLREHPPVPPPAPRPFVKTVTLPPLPAPPRSTVIEKFPNLPDRPRDIILERWLPYEPRAPGRTVRIAAGQGALPRPPRNHIIQYLPLQARIDRHFKRLGVTRADPDAYVRQFGSSLLDPTTFVQSARAAGVIEDISTPHGHVVGYNTVGYGLNDGWGRTYLGNSSDNLSSGFVDYSGPIGSYAGSTIVHSDHINDLHLHDPNYVHLA